VGWLKRAEPIPCGPREQNAGVCVWGLGDSGAYYAHSMLLLVHKGGTGYTLQSASKRRPGVPSSSHVVKVVMTYG